MDARAVLHPVGPHEPRVYWTRRAVLLAAVVVVLVLLAAYGCSGGTAKPTATSSGHPTTTPTPAPSATAAAAVPACVKSQLSVAATTDATTYPAGVLPRLTATVRTTAECRLPASAINWEIVSGTDTVYTTVGCPAASHVTYTLRPSHPVRPGRVWDRHRSVAGCATPGTSAAPGTYQLRVTVDGVQSGVAVFHLAG